MFKPTDDEIALMTTLKPPPGAKGWIKWDKLGSAVSQVNVRSQFKRLLTGGYVVTSRSRIWPDDDFYMLAHSGYRLLGRVTKQK